MAAPRFAPTPVIDTARVYSSPAVVPSCWQPNRPGDLEGFQPEGEGLGYQGPNQGYALKLASIFRERLHLQPGEHADDAIGGCFGIALRRASMFGRAPVVHDLTVAFTIWGYLTAEVPHDLLRLRSKLFEGLGHGHHYVEARTLAHSVPEATLRMTPSSVAAAFPARWRELLGR